MVLLTSSQVSVALSSLIGETSLPLDLHGRSSSAGLRDSLFLDGLLTSRVSAVISCTTALFLSGYVIQQRTLRDLRKAIRPDPRPSPKIYLPDRFKQSTTELEDGTVVNIEVHDAPSGNAAQQKKGDFVVEVRPSVPEDASQRPLQEVKGRSDAEGSSSGKDSTSEDDTRKQDAEKPAENTDEEEPMSRAERRRRIKEEIRELSQGETPMYYQRRLW